VQRSEWELRIQDMLTAIAEIHTFVDTLGLEEFGSDLRTLRTVEYNFVVLGEAARGVPLDVQVQHPLVPWPQIIGMRNLVAHQYRRVDPSVL
jgi:uncharacterized protein with HEPN domain